MRRESGQNRAPHIDPRRPGAPSTGLPAPNRQITWDRRKSWLPKPPSPSPPEFSHGLHREGLCAFPAAVDARGFRSTADRVVEDAPRILAQNSLLEMLGEILRSLVSDVFRANLPGAAIPPQAPQDGPLCGVRAGLTEVLPGLGERDLDVGDRSVRAGEFESAANVAFDIAPASRSHATPKTVSPQFSALDPSPDGLGADFQPVRDGRDRRQCQSKSA